MANNRKCSCCNTKYSYCPTCGTDRFKPTYLSQFCSETCKDLWQTATKFNMQTLTQDEAQAILKTLDLKDRSEYVDFIQRDLQNILGDTPKSVAFEPVVEVEPVAIEVAAEEVVPVAEVASMPSYKHKKKQKQHEVVTETIE